MRAVFKRLILAWVVVCVLAPAAFAQFGGLFHAFNFTFFNSFLNSVFLFPFALSGCF